MLNISIIREETIEHRLDETFQFEKSSALQCSQATVIESSYDQADEDDDYFEPSTCKDNFRNNNTKRKFVLRPRCLACTLRHHGSDDPEKCTYRGDTFRPE